jgi:hypothetical protein
VDGRYYSKYALGQSVLGVRFYLIGRFLYERSDPAMRSANPSANPIIYCACLLGIVNGSAAVVLLYLTCISLGFHEFAQRSFGNRLRSRHICLVLCAYLYD